VTATLRGRRRILVLGCSGAGKSTWARRLGGILSLPVIHLDRHYWRAGWVPRDDAEWDDVLDGLLARDEWILDGNYDRTLPRRLARADAAVFLDLPRWVCRARVARRVVGGYGRTRPDLAPGCPEKVDLGFFRWVWTWPRDVRPRVVEALADARDDVEVIRVSRPAEAEDLLRRVAGEAGSG